MAIIRPVVKSHFTKKGGSSWGGGWGGGKGASWGGGKGGGSWVFVPGFGGGGKGKGKGNVQFNRTMDKLNKIEADRKVWVGGLPKDITWKKLEKHFEEFGGTKPKISEVIPGKGTGVCAFESADDAQTAIGALNGSELEGQTIEVDVWTEKPKKEGGDRPQRKVKTQFFEKKTSAGPSLKGLDPSLKVWIGGLSPKTTAQKLKKHFVDNGCDADKADIMRKGTACVAFKTDDAASSAIGTMNGTELDGNTIEVDVWTKAEKKEKKPKEE